MQGMMGQSGVRGGKRGSKQLHMHGIIYERYVV